MSSFAPGTPWETIERVNNQIYGTPMGQPDPRTGVVATPSNIGAMLDQLRGAISAMNPGTGLTTTPTTPRPPYAPDRYQGYRGPSGYRGPNGTSLLDLLRRRRGMNGPVVGQPNTVFNPNMSPGTEMSQANGGGPTYYGRPIGTGPSWTPNGYNTPSNIDFFRALSNAGRFRNPRTITPYGQY